jgi:hypothetical protein
MANGIAIKDVDNKLQELGGEEVIPISSGADEPEVVEVDTLKEYINEDIDAALEGKQDVINDLATIRSGAALGATALQSESDPTVHAWAKEAQKPSYSYSEITGKPTLSAVATSGSYNDLTNKPEIPVLPTLADVATSGDYEDLENTPTIPNVPEWAMSSTKPSYTASEVGALPDTTVVPTESTVSGWGFTKNAGTVTSVTVNGSTYNPTNGDVDLGTIGGGGGTSVQADWAQTDSTADDYIRNKPNIGATYTAAWTANSSAAVNVALTADLTLPKGVYLVRVGFPVLSKTLPAANLVVGGAATRDTNIYYSGGTYFSGFEIVTVGDNGGTVHLQTQASTAITYTYTERGGLVAVKFV